MVREVVHARKRKPLSVWIKFCLVIGIPDVITCANFGENRSRGLGVAGGQNLPLSIDFDRRPYNTLALPCECVIVLYWLKPMFYYHTVPKITGILQLLLKLLLVVGGILFLRHTVYNCGCLASKIQTGISSWLWWAHTAETVVDSLCKDGSQRNFIAVRLQGQLHLAAHIHCQMDMTWMVTMKRTCTASRRNQELMQLTLPLQSRCVVVLRVQVISF